MMHSEALRVQQHPHNLPLLEVYCTTREVARDVNACVDAHADGGTEKQRGGQKTDHNRESEQREPGEDALGSEGSKTKTAGT
jgi:hypothetical protein